jgi:hypothetical protein
MRRHNLNLEQYKTDKIHFRYLEKYDPILLPWVDKNISLLELGILKGGSLQLWRDYFPRANIVGIDRKLPVNFDDTDRITMYQGSQDDRDFLSRVAAETAPDGYDIIIDDASHIGALSKISFWHLFEDHLKPGGLYIIEDWGTGYWDDFPDGKSLDLDSYQDPPLNNPSPWFKIARRAKTESAAPLASHSYGMVGFIKQLIDEQAASDVTRLKNSGSPKRMSKFKQMIIQPSVVFITKA